MLKSPRHLTSFAAMSLLIVSANSHAQSVYDRKKAEVQRAAARAAAEREAARIAAEERWKADQLAKQRAAEAEEAKKRRTFFPATPKGNPEYWITTNDYPTSALHSGVSGIVAFRLIVGVDGRVESCAVVESSGSAQLDQATCSNVIRRARFNPAHDGLGTPMRGAYSSRVRWEIPQDSTVSVGSLSTTLIPSLGISTGPVPSSLAQFWRLGEYGELIVKVDPGGLADEASVHTGDVLLMINGQRIIPSENITAIGIASELGEGSKVRLFVFRPGTGLIRLEAH